MPDPVSRQGAKPAKVEFWSSVEYATFQRGLLRALEDAGWRAEHCFQVTQTDYWTARSCPARLWLRGQTYGAYPLRLAGHFFRARRDRVGVVCTNTFFAPWIAAFIAGRRGPPVVHWVFDLFPDVLVLAGTMRRGSLRERLLRRLVRATFQRAAVNVFLGPRLRAYAEAEFGPIPRAVVISVGCDARPFLNARPRRRPAGEAVRVLYCGNLGRMHDVETVAAALQGGLPDGVAIEFRGNGAGFWELENAPRARDLGGRVKFAGNLPEAEWIEAMRAADVALVTMKAGAEGVVMPSKTYSALAAGQAVLAICPIESDLADTVRDHDCGWVVAPGDVAALGAVLSEISRNPEELLRRRGNAWRAGQEVFDQAVLAKAWIAVLESAQARNGEGVA